MVAWTGLLSLGFTSWSSLFSTSSVATALLKNLSQAEYLKWLRAGTASAVLLLWEGKHAL